MKLLIGRYEYVLDEKNRLGLPPKFREALSLEKSKKVYMTCGLEHCLYLFLPSQWDSLVENDLQAFSLPDKEQERAFKRKFFAEATEADLDSAGRLLVPQFLRAHARLKKTVLIQGAGKRAEIWDKNQWNSYSKLKIEPAYRLVTKKIEI
ncbi:MAG: division/cell wall cluster transcriptional repressor MraZ [Elusimicrobiota bacterium]